MNIKLKCVSAIMTIIIAISCFSYFAMAKAPVVNSESAILIDGDTGDILYEKSAYEKINPACTTKIMTLLIAASNANMDDTITVDSSLFKDLPSDAGVCGLADGEKITVKDAFMAVYLVSANDAAIVLANKIAGSVNDFVNIMNTKAKELGLKNTKYSNVTGLISGKQSTTAYDTAMLLKAAYSDNKFLELTDCSTYSIPESDKRDEPYVMDISNKLLNPDTKYYTYGALFGKSGFDDNTKSTMTVVTSRDGRCLVWVAFNNSDREDQAYEAVNMIEYGYSDFTAVTYTAKEIESLFKGKSWQYIEVENDVQIIISSKLTKDDLISNVSVSGKEAFLTIQGEDVDYSIKISNVYAKGMRGVLDSALHVLKWILFVIISLILLIAIIYAIISITVNIRNAKNAAKKKEERKRTLEERMSKLQ